MLQRFVLLFLLSCLPEPQLTSIYPEIQQTCLLKDGSHLLIKEQNYCLQEDDPEIALLSKSFPTKNREDFTVARDAYGFSYYFDCLNAYIQVEGKNLLCGTVIYIPIDQSDSLIIEFLAVEPAYQKKGIGKALITQLEEVYKARGYKIIYLQATLSSRDFYRKLGYTSPTDDMHFQKKLVPQATPPDSTC